MAVPAIHHMKAVPQHVSKKVRTTKRQRPRSGRSFLLGNTDGPRERIIVDVPAEVGPERNRAFDALGSAEAACEQARKWTNEAWHERADIAAWLKRWPQMQALPRSGLTSVEWMDWAAILAARALDALDSSMRAARATSEGVSLGDEARQLLRYAATDALRLSHEQPPEAWVARSHPLPAPLKAGA